jgi:F0F1-type ATP synthase membrane subunit b/b'
MAEARLEAELEPAREARTEAEGELSAAGAESRQIRAEAEEEAERIREAAEVEIRKAVDDGRRELIAETRDLVMARDAARDDMDMDERQVLAHRDRILSAVSDLTRLAESLGAGTREQGAESGDTTRVDGWDPAGASESGRGL